MLDVLREESYEIRRHGRCALASLWLEMRS